MEPYAHQVGGHTQSEGKPTALRDSQGRFCKPVQSRERFDREKAFYEMVERERLKDGNNSLQAVFDFVPRFYGAIHTPDEEVLVLEDLCSTYRNPSIIDIKIGFTTWYSWADEKYIDKCRSKDETTTQAKIGFRLCGMQVYNLPEDKYLRHGRKWGQHLEAEGVPGVLKTFACNGGITTPRMVYHASEGAIHQLQRLCTWFEKQKEHAFYASSVLIIYEGSARLPEEVNVTVRWVDFAHAYPCQSTQDTNFYNGLRSLIEHLSACASDIV